VCQGNVCVGNGQGAPTGGVCTDKSQCSSSTCTNGACAAGSGLSNGKSCGSAVECVSLACTNGICGSGTSGGSGTGGTTGGGGVSGGTPRMGGSPCTSNTQCSSGLCLGGVCQSGQPGGAGCSSATDCASGVCQSNVCVGNGQGVPAGGACTGDRRCASNNCSSSNVCAAGSGLPDGKSCGSAVECASGACTNGICGAATNGGTGAGGTTGGVVTGGGGFGACSGSLPPTSASGGASPGTTPPATCDPNAQDQTGCTCTPGTSRACYTGASGTRGVGACSDGTQVCIGQGELTGTYALCTGAVTNCTQPPPPPSLCTNTAVNNEPIILAGYAPVSGQSVPSNGQIKVWVQDEGAPFTAPGEVVDSKTGAVLTPGDRTAKAADGYLFEPALYIAPQTAESGGTPHFPQWIKGQYNPTPSTGRTGPATIGAPIDPVPAGTRITEKYVAEYIWDVCALGLPPGTYSAEFVIHDGDRDRAVGCVTIVIGP
jgi:hypothetical protein